MEKSGNGQNGPAVPKRLGRGVFLAFEGIDGAGKTTQAFVLKDRLEDIGLEAVYVKEPTSGQWGRKIKEIAGKGRDGLPAEKELDYFIFDREEDVRENIAPALEQNKVE
ncbi:MAG: dTMP kinase, partial [Thermodesulfobacteriota bacterium]|nr:dTMP kinase [Thermodesulfobacteriota bacterium]